MSIVISEDLWVSVPAWFLERYGEVRYDITLVSHRQALLNAVQDASVLIVRNKTRVDRELLEAAPGLAVIGRLGVGLDNIDVAVAKERGVKVVAARGCNATSVAEYVMACLLHRVRFLERSSQHVKSGIWDRGFSTGSEIYGKTIGLVGVGDIGQRVASRARAFGMDVIAYDPFVLETSALVQDVGVRLVDLETVLTTSDFVSVHVPLTPQTKYLIGERELMVMRPDGTVINTARGGVIEEAALQKVLAARFEMAAYLDVREHEPPATADALSELPNVVLTPHVAGITRESSARVAQFIFRQVGNALDGAVVQGLV
ncbi:hydroxyacid dehydrogenase [Alicyclobacillus mengziensis]|uniref:Hydroxyacid dehydrogenase n=1 Tax=Alicyclobacillus mengziensis TaxID=2931921 RepID=A0A9X7W340_9BACL|nr:hydroxyacid dehydrogenase [Alicyclobacillus mengziensis]QSO49302.1 hydroxyacid dehydrogenase [Alicyclobacillus mengziensis]